MWLLNEEHILKEIGYNIITSSFAKLLFCSLQIIMDDWLITTIIYCMPTK